MTSEEQRIKMLELSNQGLNATEIGIQLGCSKWTVRKWRQRLKKKELLYLKWDVL